MQDSNRDLNGLPLTDALTAHTLIVVRGVVAVGASGTIGVHGTEQTQPSRARRCIVAGRGGACGVVFLAPGLDSWQ